MQTLEYSPGRSADVFGDPAQSTVLMWHGAQTDSRAAMRPLAERVHGRGLAVVLADWDSHAQDRGRSDLLASASYAREHAGGSALVLVGWSMGGLAAAGLTMRARELGLAVSHTVCLAGAFMVDDPIAGAPLAPQSADGDRVAFTLLHGEADDVIPADVSREFAETLRRNDWPAECAVLAADHASIAGAAYDRAADRYSPASDAATLAVADDVAARIAGVVQLTP